MKLNTHCLEIVALAQQAGTRCVSDVEFGGYLCVLSTSLPKYDTNLISSARWDRAWARVWHLQTTSSNPYDDSQQVLSFQENVVP